MSGAIITYTDYKSPYAFLAKEMTYALEREFDVEVDWRPYTLDIPAYLGDAKVDEQGNVVAENRNPHQWRRVRYSYMDCRRQANELGLTIRGPRKIFNSSIAAVGMLFAQKQGVFRAYNDTTFERFWKRELEIEDPTVVASVLADAGADAHRRCVRRAPAPPPCPRPCRGPVARGTPASSAAAAGGRRPTPRPAGSPEGSRP